MQKNTARPLAMGLTVWELWRGCCRTRRNFAPVGSLSLYAGGRLRGWQAYLLPLVLMAATDPLVGGYSIATPFIYFSFLINVWIGSRLRSTESPLRIGAAVVVASVQFFLISNFGAWLGSFATYPHTLGGLVSCYIRGHSVLRPHAGVGPAVLGRSVRPARMAQPHGGRSERVAPQAPSVKTLPRLELRQGQRLGAPCASGGRMSKSAPS